MKFDNDEIKKIILSSMLFIGVIYCYFTFLLGPLNRSEKLAHTSLSTIEPQMIEAKKQIAKTAELEKNAPAAQQKLEQIKKLIPEGAPVAWFPPRMADFFKRQGFDKAVTRLNGEAEEKDLTGFRKLTWAIDLPKVEFVPLGLALAALENEEPLLEVTNVTMDASKEEPQFQHATLIVSTLVKQ